MKTINDSKLYLYGGIITLLIALIIGTVSAYSIFFVEPEVRNLLSSSENIDTPYKKAYIILRNPQIFAEYKNFDAQGFTVKNSISYFDRKVYFGEKIDPSSKTYLELLLDRRVKGSHLGVYTMMYLLLLSIIFCAAFITEKFYLRRVS